jgi:hypothetical protein
MRHNIYVWVIKSVKQHNLRGFSVVTTDGSGVWSAVDMGSDVYIKFYDDRFRNSHNIKVITATIWEAAVLLLLMRGIYEVHR